MYGMGNNNDEDVDTTNKKQRSDTHLFSGPRFFYLFQLLFFIFYCSTKLFRLCVTITNITITNTTYNAPPLSLNCKCKLRVFLSPSTSFLALGSGPHYNRHYDAPPPTHERRGGVASRLTLHLTQQPRHDNPLFQGVFYYITLYNYTDYEYYYYNTIMILIVMVAFQA